MNVAPGIQGIFSPDKIARRSSVVRNEGAERKEEAERKEGAELDSQILTSGSLNLESKG